VPASATAMHRLRLHRSAVQRRQTQALIAVATSTVANGGEPTEPGLRSCSSMTAAKPAFERVYWIGGSPCAGKSSIARLLSDRYGLVLYSVDEELERQRGRLCQARQPALTRWLESSWDERWMKPIDALLEDARACYREHFVLVLDDVRASPPGKPVLVEGTAILPDAIMALSVPRHRAIWITPTAEFQWDHYQRRGWARRILSDCRDPEAAFANWMRRDADFGEWIRAEAARLDLDALLVDGRMSMEQNALSTALHFGLATQRRAADSVGC
jgi:hypothetical protein